MVYDYEAKAKIAKNLWAQRWKDFQEQLEREIEEEKMATDKNNNAAPEVLTLDAKHTDLAIIAIQKGIAKFISDQDKTRKIDGGTAVRKNVDAGDYEGVKVNMDISLETIKVAEDRSKEALPTIDGWKLLAALCDEYEISLDGPEVHAATERVLKEDFKAEKKILQKTTEEAMEALGTKKETKVTTGSVSVKNVSVEVNELELL